jgi:murein DD-endopeptidase MepM/ murein hydrolase activator NlpD
MVHGVLMTRVFLSLLAFLALFAPVGLVAAGHPKPAAVRQPAAEHPVNPTPVAHRVRPPPPRPVAGFSWPLAPPHPVLRRFEPPSVPWGPGHRGVDLGGAAGDPVFAVADGVVVFAGPLVNRPVVSIDHPGGLRSTYEPVAPSVTAGQSVRRGQVIGSLVAGHPGCVACLHWGVRRGEEYLDPLMLVLRWRIRLLPWRG